MKYLFTMLLIASTFLSYSQTTESFFNLTANTSTYTNGSYIGDNGLQWTYAGARVPDRNYEINQKSIGFSRDGARYILTTSDANGIGKLSFKLRAYFDGGSAADRVIQVSEGRNILATYTLTSMTDVENFSFNINKPGEVLIKIESIGRSEVVMDDVSWTAYSAPVANGVVINEVFPFPPRGGNEYVELYNNSDRSVDISSWTISNGSSIVYTLPRGTVVGPNEFFVVNSKITDENTLSLDNSFGVVFLNDASVSFAQFAAVDEVVYAGLTEGEAAGRIPDGTGDVEILASSSEGTANATVLPVKFKSFKVTNKDSHRVVRWVTSTETNNQKFEVEISNDGVEYSTIGSVEGNGTTSEERNYIYNDYSLTDDSVVYYRIKQVDFDGSASYSNVITIKLNESVLSVYPNPVSTVLTVKGAGNFKVYDLLGKEVDVITNSNSVYTLDTSNYQSGMYVIKLDDGTTLRFVKR